MQAREVFVAGTGSFAAEIADWAGASGLGVLGLIEMRGDHGNSRERHGLPVVDIDSSEPDAPVVIGLGGDRREAWKRLSAHGWTPISVVHPAASLAADVSIGAGATIGPLSVVGAATKLSDHVIVSRGSLIGHHVQVGAFATLNPGVNIGGNAVLGEDVFVGMGATILNGVTVGDRAVIAAGAVVVRDVEIAARVQGVPARAFVAGSE